MLNGEACYVTQQLHRISAIRPIAAEHALVCPESCRLLTGKVDPYVKTTQCESKLTSESQHS
jgi:hypothetical protein